MICCRNRMGVSAVEAVMGGQGSIRSQRVRSGETV